MAGQRACRSMASWAEGNLAVKIGPFDGERKGIRKGEIMKSHDQV